MNTKHEPRPRLDNARVVDGDAVVRINQHTVYVGPVWRDAAEAFVLYQDRRIPVIGDGPKWVRKAD